MSTSDIEAIAEAFLAELDPTALESPKPLDLAGLVEDKLSLSGIHVYPASAEEMEDREGATLPGSPIQILLVERVWESLLFGGPGERRARSTMGHEIGHAVLHVPVIRRAAQYLPSGFTLNRAERGQVRSYEDSEWQAHTFSGAILMPLATMRMVRHATVSSLAAIYNVSELFVRSRLKRLKLKIPE